jgi:hypothetical protein
LVVLIVVTLLARLVGRLGVVSLRNWDASIRVGLAMMTEVATNVKGCVFHETAHWVPEERPTALTEALVAFLSGTDRERCPRWP